MQVAGLEVALLLGAHNANQIDARLRRRSELEWQLAATQLKMHGDRFLLAAQLLMTYVITAAVCHV